MQIPRRVCMWSISRMSWAGLGSTGGV
jgi:hypothetical protein